MTIQLTTNITQPNIARWRVIAFDLVRGQVTIRIGSGGESQWFDLACLLSDTVNGSTGIKINPSPVSWNDKVISTGLAGVPGVGAANSLTNAQNAYRSAGTNNAGLKAVELQALTDGWVDAALTGA